MNLKEKLENSILILDGAMGTKLQELGLPLGTLPEEWNLTHPDEITGVHRAYLEAGSDVIYANTFGANSLKLGDRTEEIVAAAIANAKRACKGFEGRFVALDIGPTGRLLKPLGDLDFEEAVKIFYRTARAGYEAGADLIVIETFNDCYELKAAVLGAKEACDLPIFATAAFGRDGLTMTGAQPEAVAALAEGLGVTALGVNCSLAPAELKEVVKRMVAVSSLPVIVKPNAGLPEERDGKTVYSLPAEDFARDMKDLAECGARVLGGCCGTTPEYINALKRAVENIAPAPIKDRALTVVSSYTKCVYLGHIPALIGERINPTGKKRLKQALRENDMAYVLNEAVTQTERGADILDVNVGLPELDEAETLARCVSEIQSVTDLPLQLDTSDPTAMERAARIYNGVPLYNSVNGKREIMERIFPIAKKYGGAVICLTLDEDGIPATADGRVAVAKKIIACAKTYGIGANRLIFDPLAMAVSADPTAANVALEALKCIKCELGCNTSLGVSNISFGLPQRDFINSTFFAMALSCGLSAAILNPSSQEMIKTFKSYLALTGKDENCGGYVEYASTVTTVTTSTSTVQTAAVSEERNLKYCILKGLKEEAEAEARKALENGAPLEVINTLIIPALDEAGKGFEQKTVFLPQLLMSAEAASAAFGVVREKLTAADNAKKTKFIIATVKGDVHDIGKNIVATLLRNYGFNVTDLGKDVPPEKIVETAKRINADIVGLSALMTTTVASMKETIELLRKEYPKAKICVGGAVLNREYANLIGADVYCADAMETVRFAEDFEAKL